MPDPRRDNTAFIRRILAVSFIEVPLIVAGGLLFAFGDDLWRLVGVGLVATTAVLGSGAILLGVRSLKCPKCGGPLRGRVDGMHCARCDAGRETRPPSAKE